MAALQLLSEQPAYPDPCAGEPGKQSRGASAQNSLNPVIADLSRRFFSISFSIG